jgi:protein SCO1/2
VSASRRLRAFAFAAAFAAGGAAAGDAPRLKAGTFDPPRVAPDFTLRRSTGGELRIADYRGQVVVLGFGFTNCPDVCPITLATLAQVHRKLGAKAADFQVVYVTVDPERDDAARMRHYLAAFNPTFVGGTGGAEELAAVRKEYGIAAEKVAYADGNYRYGHSSFTYLIDRHGRLRALMPYGRSADDYVHDVELLLAEP